MFGATSEKMVFFKKFWSLCLLYSVIIEMRKCRLGIFSNFIKEWLQLIWHINVFWLAFKSCIFHGHIQLLYLLLTISPGMPLIYSINFLVVNFFGVEFSLYKSGNCENQSLLGPVKIWSIINRGFVTSWQPSFMPVQIAVLRIPA